jgi:hypothetical protein
MKHWIFACAVLFCLARLEAATLKLDGNLKWQITEPRLTFTMDGGIQNLDSSGISGTIKLVLWATKTPYPASGYAVGQYTLGQINGGYQFSDFTVKTTSNIPVLDGTYYFTIVVTEYTTAGWRNRLLVSTGTQSLTMGNFTNQKTWTIPRTAVIAPPAGLTSNNTLVLSEKATGLRNRFPVSSQIKTTLDIGSGLKLQASNVYDKSPGSYTYQVGSKKLRGKNVPAAVLSISYNDPGGYIPSTDKIILYFHTANSGIYKSATKLGATTETIWGTFTLQ